VQLALPCRVPQGPGMDHSMRVIVTRLLPDSTRYYYEFVLPSNAKLGKMGRSKYSDSCIANRYSANQLQPTEHAVQYTSGCSTYLLWHHFSDLSACQAQCDENEQLLRPAEGGSIQQVVGLLKPETELLHKSCFWQDPGS